MRTRTIEGAARHFRELDPDTAITAHAIRQAVISGAVGSVRAGQKYLVTIENLESYLAGESMPAEQPEPSASVIRRIGR